MINLPVFFHLEQRQKKVVLHIVHMHLLCCETYNIHDGQDVLLDVSATMVTHHHLVCNHQRLHVALPADWALQRQLAATDVMRRRLQSSLPPRSAFHRLLVWGRSHTFTFQEKEETHKSTAAITRCVFVICRNWPRDHRWPSETPSQNRALTKHTFHEYRAAWAL